ncbi:4Fe-4S dicluster domain-containing protein [candidate division GN15 bacterium]|nr:4Fe-4S dicluster domain-containing protein [candidate division GN15 bacterium]
MGFDRRKFLKLSGLTFLGFAAGSPARVFGQQDTTMVDSTATGDGTITPISGSRWAMLVDLRACNEKGGEDCDDCIAACHRVHNVPEFDDSHDEIKWIWKTSFHSAFHSQEHEFLDEAITHGNTMVLCNHCDRPPCVRVCPTQATWKRESDGIVMMDMHRCIGCRYCVVACPYGARSFNFRDPRPHIEEINPKFPTRMRGVVEKCNFCAERLATGKMPACVKACKHGALKFGDLEDPQSEVRKILGDGFSIRRRPELGTQPQVYYLV